jgi:hypothetical protein
MPVRMRCPNPSCHTRVTELAVSGPRRPSVAYWLGAVGVAIGVLVLVSAPAALDAKRPAAQEGEKKPQPKPPAGNGEIAFAEPDLKAVALGEYKPDSQAPDVLLQRGAGANGAWARLGGKATEVASVRPLRSLPGMRGKVALTKGLELLLWGTEPEVWPNNLLFESMVELYHHPVLDLDLALRRGRVVIRNTRPGGKPAVVRVRFEDPTRRKQSYFDITLRDGETKVALERMCEIPRDEPFYEDPANANRRGPLAHVYCFFLSGSGDIRSSDIVFTVSAEKSPHMSEWSSLQGLRPPVPFNPDWASADPKAGDPAARKEAVQAAMKLSRGIADKALDVVLKEAIASDAPPVRRLGLRCYTALDNLSVPVEVLNQDSTSDDLRRTAIYSLRYWIALERDNEYKLYKVLREHFKGKAVARKVLELLHGISTAEGNDAATWQRLIDDLDNPVLALRALSAWNLDMLVPAGRKIAYSPAGPQEMRHAAQAQWRKLIPPGNLPPAPEPPPKKE